MTAGALLSAVGRSLINGPGDEHHRLGQRGTREATSLICVYRQYRNELSGRDPQGTVRNAEHHLSWNLTLKRIKAVSGGGFPSSD